MTISQHTINTPYMVGPVHCYTAELGGDLVLFDTGPPTPQGQRYLQEHIDLSRLRHVIVTHCHIDHYGQSSWLSEQGDAAVYLPYRDSLKVLHNDERMQKMYGLLSRMGFSQGFLVELGELLNRNVLFPPFPKKYLIAEQDIPAHLGIEVLSCPGHSQSDLVYVGEDWAVTGDTLLRGIFQSPMLDVDVVTGERFRNYEAYCASLIRLAGLRDKRILPGHRHTVDSVDAILLFYISKMLLRVEQLRPYSRGENVAEIIEKLFGGSVKNVFHVYIKASEIIFMKDFLEQPEMLRASLEDIGLFDDLAEHFCRAVGL
jgi:2,4-dienoyl-CoA reductase (NADPH2)